MHTYRIDADYADVRLDKFLFAQFPDVPKSHLYKMIRLRRIRVDGKRTRPEALLQVGQQIEVRGVEVGKRDTATPTQRTLPAGAAMPPVLYEDEWLLVINKPSGMAVHPGSGIRSGTVVDVARAYLGTQATRNGFSASPAHRLDRETSGVLVVAKRRPAMVRLTQVFTEHLATKRYVALVRGKMPRERGLIDKPLAEHQQTQRSRSQRGVNLQAARTRYEVVEVGGEVTLVRCLIETGRTHQIRRHFALLDHPVLGDNKYGDFALNRIAKKQWGLDRLFLHAELLSFEHPKDGRRLRFEAPLPQDLLEASARAGLRLAAGLRTATSP